MGKSGYLRDIVMLAAYTCRKTFEDWVLCAIDNRDIILWVANWFLL